MDKNARGLCLSSPMSVGLDSFDSHQSKPIDPSDGCFVVDMACRGENDVALTVVNIRTIWYCVLLHYGYHLCVLLKFS
jgi:hypothetical protein